MLKNFRKKFESEAQSYVNNKSGMSKRQKKNLKKKSSYLKKKYFDKFLEHQKNQGNLPGKIILDDFEKVLNNMDLKNTKLNNGNRYGNLKMKGKDLRLH